MKIGGLEPTDTDAPAAKDPLSLDAFTKDARARRKHVRTPSELGPKILCLGFKPKKWTQYPKSIRRQWRLLHSIAATKAIIDYSSRGHRFLRVEERSGNYNGRVDVYFEDSEGRPVKVEVEGSGYLKDPKIIQGVLYHEPSDRIAIAALNETLEPEPWFIAAVKLVASEVESFLRDHPDKAALIFTPHPEVCPRCSSGTCPISRGSRFEVTCVSGITE